MKAISVSLVGALLAGALATPDYARAQGLVELYEFALRTNPDLLAQARTRDAVQETVNQAQALLLPNLSGSASFSRTFNFNEPPGVVDGNQGDIALSLIQPVYNRRLYKGIDQAEAVADQAEANLISTGHSLLFTVAQRYFDVLAAQEVLTFALKDKEAIGRQLEQAKRRFEVGLITITAVQEAQARFDTATADEILARVQLADTKELLRQVVGRYYDQINLLDPEVPLEPPVPNDVEEWVVIALANNPQIMSARFAADAAREEIEIARSDRYPEVDFTASYGRITTSGALDDTRYTGQLGIQLNVPLFQGGGISSRVRQEAFEFESSKQQLEATQRDVVQQVRISFQDLTAALSRIRALEQSVVSNNSALEATQAGFEVGTRTIVDVLDAERNLFLAEQNLAVERFDYLVNYLSLLQAAGRIDLRDLAAIDQFLTPDRKTTKSDF
ncbi:MAG: TolC family outer membrane protein [Candidatus Competibacterales bacterium]